VPGHGAAALAFHTAEWLCGPGQSETAEALAKRSPAVLKGVDLPHDTAERMAFAQMAYDREHFTAAARFWGEAFAADPKLLADRSAPTSRAGISALLDRRAAELRRAHHFGVARFGRIDRSVGWRLQDIVLQAGSCFVVETITSPILILTPLLLE